VGEGKRSTAVVAGCGWDVDKERESEDVLRSAKDDVWRCAQVHQAC
jgi:hypothetical protein